MGIGKNGFYTLDDILKYGCNWMIIYGDRAKGKSYAPKKRALEYAWQKQEPTLGYVRRYRDDISSELVTKYFEDRGSNLIEEVSGGQYNCADYYRGYICLPLLFAGKKIHLN